MKVPQPVVMQTKRPETPRGGLRLFMLAYTLFVFMGPLMAVGTWSDWALAFASIALFLPLYFAYWGALDHRRSYAMVFVVAIAILGLLLVPFNAGATTYVIYSAALVPFALSPRLTIAYLGGLATATFLVAFAYPDPARYWVSLPTIVVAVMVGGGNLFYAENHRRNLQLWRAQQDVEGMATLAERERISRDLHDLLGHTLSVIALKSELAAKVADTDPARAAKEIREVERVSRDALSEVRAAVEGYRGRGFSGELRSAAGALEAAGVRLIAEVGPVSMTVRQESVVAMALREAVTNVVRHAGASTCRVRLQENHDHTVLTVHDDGVGGAFHEGLGLAGMRERAAALGGTVSLDGSSGTLITVTLPGVPATETR